MRYFPFSPLTLLAGWQEWHPACKSWVGIRLQPKLSPSPPIILAPIKQRMETVECHGKCPFQCLCCVVVQHTIQTSQMPTNWNYCKKSSKFLSACNQSVCLPLLWVNRVLLVEVLSSGAQMLWQVTSHDVCHQQHISHIATCRRLSKHLSCRQHDQTSATPQRLLFF